MTSYQRVRVTAPAGPQMRLAEQFPSEEYSPEAEQDTILLIADPERVQSFIDQQGAVEGWGQWVDDITVTPIDDPARLPYALQGLVEEGRARVWDYARDLIPDGAVLDDFIWNGRVSFTWRESVIDRRNAEPPTVDTLQTWVDDEYFDFDRHDANPTQNPDFDGGEGPVFSWADQLAATHPEAELRVTGDLCAPRTGAPHGFAFLNGLAISMQSGGPLDDAVVDWCKRRFWAEYDEVADRYVGTDAFIGQADEFGVYDTNGREWIRLWWD